MQELNYENALAANAVHHFSSDNSEQSMRYSSAKAQSIARRKLDYTELKNRLEAQSEKSAMQYENSVSLAAVEKVLQKTFCSLI